MKQKKTEKNTLVLIKVWFILAPGGEDKGLTQEPQYFHQAWMFSRSYV